MAPEERAVEIKVVVYAEAIKPGMEDDSSIGSSKVPALHHQIAPNAKPGGEHVIHPNTTAEND
jgi:hypothetical protein